MAIKVSKTAKITACVAFFLVSWVFAYGHGYKRGTSAQLTLEKALNIAKAQFICKMEQK